MALTKISTGGVKDSAIGSEKIADGNVRQSDLDGECVNESKIQISNAGTNGQFLQKQSGASGGLTWATVDSTPEGTAIQSTGESGTGKFLRTDGDGTSSWQPVPSDNTKANLDGADFTGEVALKGSSVQAKFYDPSDTSNYIHFKAPSLTANTDYTLPATDGSVDQILKTDGSGALGWTTISAAPEITGTASGTITSEKACIIKSDGTIDQVESIATEQTPAGVTNVSGGSATAGAPTTSSGAHTPENNSIAYDETNNRFLVQDRYGSNTYVQLGRYTDNTDPESLVLGGLVAGGSGYGGDVCFDASKECFVTIIQTTSGTTNVRVFKYTDSNKTQVSQSCTGSLPSGTSASQPTIIYHTGIQKPVIAYTAGGQPYFSILHLNSDATSCTVGTRSTVGGTWTGYAPRMFEDTVRSAAGTYRLYIGVRLGGDDQYYIFNYTLPTSGDSVTKNNNGVSLVDNSSNNEVGNIVGMRFNPEDQKAIGIWSVDSDHEIKARVITPTDSSVSIGSYVVLGDTNDTKNHSNQAFAIVYEANLKKLVYIYRKYSDGKARARVLTISGTSLSGGTYSSNLTSSSCNIGKSHSMGSANAIYNSKLKQIIWVGSMGNYSRVWNLKCSTAVSNLTSENFVGFPNATYTNGQTATIKVVGNTSTQSSLTPGQKYYVQADGNLGTNADTPSVEAGVALSSTKLLIK